MEFAQTPSGGFLYKQLQEKKKEMKRKEKTNQLKINKYNKNSHKESRGRDETVIILVMIFMKDVDFAFGSWVPLLL